MEESAATLLDGTPSPEQQVQDLHALLDITRALAGTLQLDDLLKLILGSLQKALRSEAQDRAGKLFGEKRMGELIVRHAERSAAELIQAMKTAVEEYIAGGRQLDDFTAVVVKRCP